MFQAIAIPKSKEYNKNKQMIIIIILISIKKVYVMNLSNLPLHKICVDKSSCIAEQNENHTLTADLTKDVFRKRLRSEQAVEKFNTK